MTIENEDVPPELPPLLPPRLPRTGPTAGPKPLPGRRTAAVAAATVAAPISAAIGAAVVYGATHAVNYLTVDGLLGSLFGLSVALWPVAGLLFAGASNNQTSQQSGKGLAAIGVGITLVPAMAVARGFISAHLSRNPPAWSGECAGLMFAAAVVAACIWGLFGMLITYTLVTGNAAKIASASGPSRPSANP